MVQEGVLLSTALIRKNVLPDMALNMLAIGEEIGEMDKMLSKVADFYEDEVEAMVKALTSMLEPEMIVMVGEHCRINSAGYIYADVHGVRSDPVSCLATDWPASQPLVQQC